MAGLHPAIHPGPLRLAITPWVGALSTGNGFGHSWGRNGKSCVAVGFVSRTAGVLVEKEVVAYAYSPVIRPLHQDLLYVCWYVKTSDYNSTTMQQYTLQCTIHRDSSATQQPCLETNITVGTHYSSAHQPPLAARPRTYLFQTGSYDVSIHPRHLSVLPTVVFHRCCRHDIQTTAAVFYLTSSGRSARSSLNSRQAGVSGFWYHRSERPASPRRISAVTRGFQTTFLFSRSYQDTII